MPNTPDEPAGSTLPGGTADALLALLKTGIETLVAEIDQTPVWQTLTAPNTTPELAQAIMREVYAEIAAYQPDVIEATIAIIGQFPRSIRANRIRAMLVHQAEEWDHGEMAVRDFAGLGSDEGDVRSRPMTPSAFATAAFWRMLAHKRLPFAYLGALYLFEGLTPIVTGRIKSHLLSRGFSKSNLEFIEFHSTEDVRHATIVDALIRHVAGQFPDKRAEMLFGFDAFRHVYPLPGWYAAFERAVRSTADACQSVAGAQPWRRS